MQHAFETLVGDVRAALQAGEQFTLGYSAEQSQFVRFNHAKVRQAGEVSQACGWCTMAARRNSK